MKIEIVNTMEDGSPQYRLGDAVLLRHRSCGQMAFNLVANDACNFNNTILHDYSSRIDPNDQSPQWQVLKDIVNKKSEAIKLDPPLENELVIHLRLGNAKGYKLSAAIFVDYIQDLIDGPGMQIDRITTVTAIHNGKLFLEKISREQRLVAQSSDVEKLEQIFNLLSKEGIKARLYSHGDIDKEFCFLSKSRYLVLGNGHFSLCAALVSNARCFVPPWARDGNDVDMDILLESREHFYY